MPPIAPPNAPVSGFTAEQEQYLRDFFADAAARGAFLGIDASGRFTSDPGSAASGNLAAEREPLVHGTPLSELSLQERWKFAEHPLDSWSRLEAHAALDKAPDAENNFRFRWHGLFHVAPAQDGFMLRLRLPGGEINAHQLAGLAAMSEELAGGYAHITTRANLQLREIRPSNATEVLMRLEALGITARGSGADNLRNITASPDSGLAQDEVHDVRPLARALHHYILNHRDLYDLPRKFNIAFDSGSSMSTAADTNDIGFTAVRATEETLSNAGVRDVQPGVYLRVALGGITGHKEFAKDCGLLVRPSEAVACAAAMVRVFARNGDRTDRKKARLKYLLERWGMERFVDETAALLAQPLIRAPLSATLPRSTARKHAWIGVIPQRQPGTHMIGLSVPVGRLESESMRALASLATNAGGGPIRLTAWQSLLLTNVPTSKVAIVKSAALALGFNSEPSPATDGIIACTGSRGCKYAGSDTKGSALKLIQHLRNRAVALDTPINIHFTGCQHSCAQHYCGDLGFLGIRLPDGTDGYHIFVGGGMDNEQSIARELHRAVPASKVNDWVEATLRAFLSNRAPDETFHDWAARHSIEALRSLAPV